MESVDKEKIREKLEQNMMILDPETYLQKYIRSLYDIYKYRVLLKQLPYKDYVVQYLANFILSALSNKQRFRQLDSLKVIKSITKCQHSPELSADTISILFRLYQHYIFYEKDEMQWCMSSILKDRPLLDSEISWIIDNCHKSKHLINRLLKYPFNNCLIDEWAHKMYKSEKLKGRKSELIGILIKNNIPDFVKQEKIERLIWAAFYSKVGLKIKSKILKSLFSPEALDSFIKVCVRLELPTVMRFAIKKLNGKSFHIDCYPLPFGIGYQQVSSNVRRKKVNDRKRASKNEGRTN